jgi:hypothetical protein
VGVVEPFTLDFLNGCMVALVDLLAIPGNFLLNPTAGVG